MNPELAKELQPRDLNIKDVLADMPRSEGVTTWHNTLDVPQTVKLFVGRVVTFVNEASNRERREINDRLTIVIPPGGKAKIPSKYDGMIQTRNANGYVVAGLAPMLTKVGDPAPLAKGMIPVSEEQAEADREQRGLAKMRNETVAQK